MTIYKVDLDYESSLFDPNYQADSSASKKIIREFEYVFFLIEKEKCSLKNYKDYEKRYLDGLSRLGFSIPTLDSSAKHFQYWWGCHHNRAIEQLLNSKLTSARIAKENGWGFHEGAIVGSIDEVKAHILLHPNKVYWLLKRPHGFSGIGHYQFNVSDLDESVLQKILSGPTLLEPIYDRVFDIGTTFLVDQSKIGRQFMVENFNSKNGRFLGGAGAQNVDKFKKYIHSRYDFDLSELEVIACKIAKKYQDMGAVTNIQIDSFIYRENGELKLYPLVEVNYRKTMGLVIQTLADKFTHESHIEWRIEPSQNSAFQTDENCIKLSPEGNRFHSYFQRY